MNKQRGITLIGAIFVLIIVSLLGQYLVSISNVQRQTSLLSLQSARAYQAASATLEWGVASIIASNNCPATTPSSFNQISRFSLSLNCSKLGDYDENNVMHSVFLLNSRSQYGNYGSSGYVSRTLEVTVHVP